MPQHTRPKPRSAHFERENVDHGISCFPVRGSIGNARAKRYLFIDKGIGRVTVEVRDLHDSFLPFLLFAASTGKEEAKDKQQKEGPSILLRTMVKTPPGLTQVVILLHGVTMPATSFHGNYCMVVTPTLQDRLCTTITRPKHMSLHWKES